MHRGLWFTTRVIPTFLIGCVTYAALFGEQLTPEEEAEMEALRREARQRRSLARKSGIADASDVRDVDGGRKSGGQE